MIIGSIYREATWVTSEGDLLKCNTVGFTDLPLTNQMNDFVATHTCLLVGSLPHSGVSSQQFWGGRSGMTWSGAARGGFPHR